MSVEPEKQQDVGSKDPLCAARACRHVHPPSPGDRRRPLHLLTRPIRRTHGVKVQAGAQHRRPAHSEEQGGGARVVVLHGDWGGRCGAALFTPAACVAPNLRAQFASVSLSAYAYLLSELIQYAVEKASSTGELEDRCVVEPWAGGGARSPPA